MNLYTQAALAITQECRIRIELLNRSMPLILQGEKLADALNGKGIKTVATYSESKGLQLKTEVPSDALPVAINTLNKVAAAQKRTVITESTGRRLLVPTDPWTEDTRAIELHIEEI